MLELAHKNSSLLVLVPASSQDLRAKLHLQLDLSALDILGKFGSREHRMHALGESSDTMAIESQDLESELMPSTSWEHTLVSGPLPHGP